jgi:hypothetical protein
VALRDMENLDHYDSYALRSCDAYVRTQLYVRQAYSERNASALQSLGLESLSSKHAFFVGHMKSRNEGEDAFFFVLAQNDNEVNDEGEGGRGKGCRDVPARTMP